MIISRHIGAWWGAAGVLILSTAAAFSAAAPATELSGREIARRIITRAQAQAQDAAKHRQYTYKKVTVSEELDRSGQVKERKEKLLFFRSGTGELLEMKVNGRPLNAESFRKQEELAAQERMKLNGGKSAQRDDWEKYLTPELLTKYHFRFLEKTNCNGRPTYVVSFEPLSRNLPVKQMADRLMNQIAGKIWVDAQEFEVARAEVNLQSEVSLWGGVLGTLRKLNYVVDRTRLDENVWFNRSTYGDFEGRKLLDNTHMKLRSESSNFQRVLPMSSR